jgi:hypothetical protein
LSYFDQMAVRIAYVATDLVLVLFRRRQELSTPGTPFGIHSRNVFDPDIDLRVARRQSSATPCSWDPIYEATEPHDGVVQRIDDLGESPQGGQDRNEFIDARRQLLRVGVDALRRRTQSGYLLGDLARVSVDACGTGTKLGQIGGDDLGGSPEFGDVVQRRADAVDQRRQRDSAARGLPQGGVGPAEHPAEPGHGADVYLWC